MEKLFSNQNIMASQIYKKMQLRDMGCKVARRAPDIHRADSNQADLEPEFGGRLQISIQECLTGQIVRMPRNCLGDPTGV